MSKITQTVLDPSYEVGSVHYSDEHEGAQYFTKDGKRIPFIEREVDYKPEYDFETSDVKHFWYRNESVLYRDVHIEVARFRSRNTLEKYIKAIVVLTFDKYIGRFLSLGREED